MGQSRGTNIDNDLELYLDEFRGAIRTGSAWATVPGASVPGNDKVWRKFTFSPLTTSKIRLYVTNVAGDNRSQVVELEAYTPSGEAKIQWLLTDHLGTPRMVLDQTGDLNRMKRHDYLPFGEELFEPTGGRTAAQGYASGDGVRQHFTSKERDIETDLDYFEARYYSSAQGRFTSPDEFTGGPDELYYFVDDATENPTFYAELSNPQSLNKYQYAYGNPLRYVDPDGHEPTPDPEPQDPCGCKTTQKQANEIRSALEKVDETTSKPLFPITDIIGTSTPPTIDPIPIPPLLPVPLPKDAAPSQSTAQPQAPPAPIQAHKKKKQSTGKNKDHPKDSERPGRPNTRDRTSPNWKPRQRPPNWPKGKPWPPWKNPRPKDWPKYKPWPPKPDAEAKPAPQPKPIPG